MALASLPWSLSGQEAPRTVAIEAICAGNEALSQVSIDPWTLHLPVPSEDTNRNVEVAWVLQNSSPDSIAIQAKEAGNWPFGLTEMRGRGQGQSRAPRAKMLGQLPRRGRRGQPKRVERGDRYSYNVVFYCTVEGESYTVAIDPDIDIGN